MLHKLKSSKSALLSERFTQLKPPFVDSQTFKLPTKTRLASGWRNSNTQSIAGKLNNTNQMNHRLRFLKYSENLSRS